MDLSALSDWSQYKWRRSAANPAVFERHTAGAERYVDFQNTDADGQYTIALAVEATLARPLDAPSFLRVLRQAWMALRFAVPTIAVNVVQSTDGGSLLRYQIAQDEANMQAWAERTVCSLAMQPIQGAVDQVLECRLPDERGAPTRLYHVPRSGTEHIVILHVHHAIMDGIASKETMTRFMALVARYVHNVALVASDLVALSWGSETENLSPAWPHALATTEATAGPELTESLNRALQAAAALGSVHGYRHRPISNSDIIPRRVFHTFTKVETAHIIECAKGKDFTVNQLLNATMYASVLLDNPVPANDDTVLASFCIINTRARLQEPYNRHFGCPTPCFSFPVMVVPVADVLQVDASQRLDALAHILKQEYIKEAKNTALLGATIQFVDTVLQGVKAHTPSPLYSPWYSGDGIADRDLDAEYNDDAGETAIRIEDFIFSVRQVDPGPCFRTHTWRGRLTINMDYNEAVMPWEAVEGFKESVVDMLLKL